MIKYKQIDAAIDMVIATSGSPINYNRIIHSSSSPYSVDTGSSKTYIDPTAPSTHRLYGLYIIDVDNAVSFIWDSSS
jgi:hypothetical protein